MSLIFLFRAGVGLAPAGPDNPLSKADMPALRGLLGGPLTLETTNDRRPTTKEDGNVGRSSLVVRPVLLMPIDATLGVPGLPQSGTGQVALLAGVNAARLHGRHQPHFPPVALRPLLAERSVLRRVVERGGRATFANAFGPRYWQALAARRLRRSASVIATEGAGLRFRNMDDLRAGRAMAWDVTGAALREREPDAALPLFTPRQAGANLASLAEDHDLVFYESFLPDLAGHGRLTTDRRPPTAAIQDHETRRQGDDSTADLLVSSSPDLPVSRRSAEAQILAAMNLLDGLLGSVLAALRPEDSLLISSDHGNVESLAAPAHTRNPVPLLAVGPAAAAFAEVESIAEIADAIERVVE